MSHVGLTVSLSLLVLVLLAALAVVASNPRACPPCVARNAGNVGGGARGPGVAVIATGNNGDLEGEPIEHFYCRAALRLGLVPLREGVDVVMVHTEALAETVPALYDRGVRIFVGANTTREMEPVMGFLNTHPDAFWLTSFSTSDAIESRGNLFRSSTPDRLTAPYFRRFLTAEFPVYKWLTVYDSTDAWASGLARMLGYPSLAIANATPKALAELPPQQGVIFIQPTNADFFRILAAVPRSAPFVTAPHQAFYPFSEAEWRRIGRPFHAFAHWNASKVYPFGHRVFGRRVASDITSLLEILWYASDVWNDVLHGDPAPPADIMRRAFGATGANFFGEGDFTSNLACMFVHGSPTPGPDGDHWRMVRMWESVPGMALMEGVFRTK